MLDALTLDQARMFVAVAEHGSFSAAARKLQRVQSAVSQSVIALERTLRVELFDRGGRQPTLTAAGLALLTEARDLIARADALRSRAGSFAAGIEPKLAIAVDPLFPIDTLMESLRLVKTRFPATTITLIASGLGGPERLLRTGKVALAIYAPEVTASSDLDMTFLMRTAMVPVVASDHPLAEEKRVDRETLARTVQLVLSDDIDEVPWSRGVLGRELWRFQDLRTRVEFLLAGFGWCSLPSHIVAPLLASGQLHRLQVEGGIGYELSLFSACKPSQSLGLCGRAFLEQLKQLAAELL